MRLSDHFTLAEAAKSYEAQRRGIDNTPPFHLIESLAGVAKNILEPVRSEFGVPFSPSSWYRSPELNRAIGGSEHSQHCTGHAVDFELPGISNWMLSEWCSDNLEFDQLILEFMKDNDPTAGWIHCSYVHNMNRGQILRIDSSGTRSWRF